MMNKAIKIMPGHLKKYIVDVKKPANLTGFFIQHTSRFIQKTS